MTAPDVEATTAAHTEPRSLLEPGRRGVVRLFGGPGTGKSTLLVDTAAAHTPPASIRNRFCS